MEVDAPKQLTTASMDDHNYMSDSDDCQSVDEDTLQMKLARVDEKEKDDYHRIEVEDRLYQKELLELAKKQNIIICLPTGSGKTYIALELTRYMIPEAIEKEQKIIFLANNVPLVNQQAEYFSQNLSTTTVKDDQVVRAITGDLNVDIWLKEQWNEVVIQCHIIVASTQIILDAITKGFIKWNQIALLILDECHHAQKKHPMAELMRLYGERLSNKGFSHVPRILGLTATIIKGKSKTVRIPLDIEEIEQLLCSKAVTHRDYEEVLKNSTSTILKIVHYDTNYKMTDAVCQDITQLVALIENLPKSFGTTDEISIVERINHPTLTSEEQIYNKGKKVSKSVKSFLVDLLKTYEELGPYCCKLATNLKIVYLLQWMQELDCESVRVDESDDTFQNSIFVLVDRVKTTLLRFKDKLDNLMNQMAMPTSFNRNLSVEAYKVRYCVSNKIEELWKILESKRPSGNPEQDKENQLCGIIFCQRRITTQVIRWYLEQAAKDWPDKLGFIRPEMMIGHSTIVEDNELARFTTKRQTHIVHQFHKRELNLLVATQIVEEGLNVPECNLVIRLDSITSYPSFIQSLGRARKQGALCYALIDNENKEKENCKINGYIKYNEKLAQTLEENAIHVGDDEEVDLKHYIDLIPPFNPSGDPDGAIITSTEAVSLVHRYCNALSCDKIATLFPTAWSEERGEESMKNNLNFKARVLLPIISPIRDVVEGEWMPDKTLAKRSAYLECCRRLWKEGELTENLLPKPRSIENFKCQFLEDLKNELAEEKKTAEASIGTKKRTQWYRKKEPVALVKAVSIIANATPSVYKLTIKMTKFVGEERYKGLYDFDQYGLFYGIVTNANLEGLPKFTLNASYGTFQVCIEQRNKKQKISSSEIALLENFQVFLSEFVFNIKNAMLNSDPQRSIMIAPLNQDPTTQTLDIDWQLIRNLNNDEDYYLRPSERLRNEMKFCPQNYENKILIPWYKNEIKVKPELLCSISVLDVNAQSPFSNPTKARTFEEYFSKTYGLTIFHPTFPMINCKEIGKQINFLTKKVDCIEMRKLKQPTVLNIIPELVNIHVLPASMYVQGKFLPSILQRIYRLLLANEFRKSVAVYFKWQVNSNEDDISYSLDEDDEREDVKDDFETTMQRTEVNVTQIATTSKEAEGKKRKFFLLETIDPLTLDLDMIFKSIDSPPKKVKTTYAKYSLPEPPTFKSDVCNNLVDIDEVKSYHFDKETDCSMERGPNIHTVMEATTLINALDHINLEKLEIMGDSVLKLIVSLHIFRSYPRWDEGKMTQLRMQLICNLHMYQLGTKLEIGEWLSGGIFIPNKSWLPPGFTIPESVQAYVLSKNMDYAELSGCDMLENDLERLPFGADQPKSSERDGKAPHTTFTHSHIGDKSVADCMEAIIGAYFVNGGLDGAFKIMDFIGMRGPLEDGNVTKYSRESTMSAMEFEQITKKQTIIPFLQDLESTLQYKFKNPWLAVEALSHPTYMGNRVTPCYERLEYVGDAILDFLVTNYILEETNITDPGKITDLRSALVNNITFASLAVKYQFHKFLKYHSELLKNFIDQFDMYQQENNHKVSDQCKLLSDYDCPTVQEIDVPKVLGDLFESIAGAIFVDSMSIDTVWKVFYRLMKNELEEFSKNIPKSPLRELYELFPGKVKFVTSSEEAKSTAPAISPKLQIVYLEVPSSEKLIQGVGTTIKQAKQAAAKYVVKKYKYPEL